MDVYRRVNVFYDGSDIVVGDFIIGEDGAFLLVCLKQGFIIQGQSKRVGQNFFFRYYFFMVFVVIIIVGNVFDFGISLVDFVVCIVDGQIVGLMNIFINYNGSSFSIVIYISTFDFWYFVLVRLKYLFKKCKMWLLKIVI